MTTTSSQTHATPSVTELQVVPVAGRDSMLLNLSGAHGPFFTRNIVILKDSAGHTGLGEVPGGERIRQTLEDARPLVVGQRVGNYQENPQRGARRLRRSGRGGARPADFRFARDYPRRHRAGSRVTRPARSIARRTCGGSARGGSAARTGGDAWLPLLRR